MVVSAHLSEPYLGRPFFLPAYPLSFFKFSSRHTPPNQGSSSMTRRFILSIAAVLAIGACSDVQESTDSNSNPESALAVAGNAPINVVLKSKATAADLAALGKYGTVINQLPKIKAVIMTGPKANIPAIRALKFVRTVNLDAERNIPPNVSIPLANFTTVGINTWDLDAVNVTNFKSGPDREVAFDGTGVYVAILDTGLLPTWRYYFPAARIATQYARSFGGAGNDRGKVSEQPNKWEHDVNSHGTHVTSTVIGYLTGLAPVNGVASNATIIPVKVLNQNGSGWSSVIAQGITYIGDLKAGPLRNSPVVINMSLGGPVLDDVEREAINYAITQGVIIVASAGNAGDAGMGYPGAYGPVISVAASGWTGEWTCHTAPPVVQDLWFFGLGNTAAVNCDVPEADAAFVAASYITDFSSRAKTGQDLDVAAPGSWVLGPYQLSQGKTSFFFLGGTSMASPHVAGIAALMAQKNGSLTGPQVETILQNTALSLPAGTRNIFDPNIGPTTVTWGADATGHGLARADKALGGI